MIQNAQTIKHSKKYLLFNGHNVLKLTKQSIKEVVLPTLKIREKNSLKIPIPVKSNIKNNIYNIYIYIKDPYKSIY